MLAKVGALHEVQTRSLHIMLIEHVTFGKIHFWDIAHHLRHHFREVHDSMFYEVVRDTQKKMHATKHAQNEETFWVLSFTGLA